MDSALLLVWATGTVYASRVIARMRATLRISPVTSFGTLFLAQYYGKKGDVYNILWALVFGFATLNILSLGARRMEPHKNRMNFGELIAVLVVIASVVLLGWEMLHMFKLLPIRIRR
jgi:hypothetical protein